MGDNIWPVASVLPSKMRLHSTTRIATAACALASTLLCAQTHHTRHNKAAITQPATPKIVEQQPVVPPQPLTPAELPAQPASVTYANGLLTVTAHNSSLNQILRDIARETQMKITGGVADERVFGSYGPGSAAHVLNSLLDGTSSNMLLVGSNGHAPAELVLTPRGGGATPPNPMAASFNQSNQADEPPSREPYNPGPPEQNTPANPPETTPEPPAAASQDSDQQQAPNGVKTPQDIFNQLMKLRQQQSQQHTNQQ